MRAIILAAGRGSRMGDLTSKAPKCLTMLAGKPLLEWQLEALRGAGIAEVGVVRGYMAEKIASQGINRFENPRWAETNMVMSLVCARSWLEESDCIVSYSDIVYPASTVTKLVAAGGDLAITYDVNWRALWRERFADPLTDAETFRTDAEGLLTEIGGRAGSLDEIKGQYMGLLKFSPSAWRTVAGILDELPAEVQNKLDMTSLLKRLINAGVRINTVPITAPWFEVDNEADLELYQAKARKKGGLF
jgi:L-glutamine-phosphate cytidylyltransferase